MQKYDPEMGIILNHYLGAGTTEQMKLFNDADAKFNQFVRPNQDLFKGPQGQAWEDAYHSCFFDWFIFDYEIEPGKTLLQKYLETDAATEPAETPENLDQLRQAEQTHISRMFFVGKVHPARQIVNLIDPIDDKVYEVHNAGLSSAVSSDEGIVGIRIICINGQWVPACNPAYCYNHFPITDELRALLKEPGKAPTEMLQLIEQRYGSHDLYEQQEEEERRAAEEAAAEEAAAEEAAAEE